MSALNFVNYGTHVVIIQDAATYDDAGTITGLAAKGQEIKDWKAFVASVGNANAAPYLQRVLPWHFESIDELARDGEVELSAWDIGPDMCGDNPIRFCSHVVGWSSLKSRMLCVQLKWDRERQRVAVDSDAHFYLSPPPSDALMDEFFGTDGGEDSRALAALQRPEFQRRLLESQRRFRNDETETIAPGKFLVGGFVTVTWVTANGPQTHKLLEWPEDKVGAAIEPAPMFDLKAHPEVTPLQPLNRAARRRLAKASQRIVA